MAEVKFVVNDPKTGKSYQKTLEDNPTCITVILSFKTIVKLIKANLENL